MNDSTVKRAITIKGARVSDVRMRATREKRRNAKFPLPVHFVVTRSKSNSRKERMRERERSSRVALIVVVALVEPLHNAPHHITSIVRTNESRAICFNLWTEIIAVASNNARIRVCSPVGFHQPRSHDAEQSVTAAKVEVETVTGRDGIE